MKKRQIVNKSILAVVIIIAIWCTIILVDYIQVYHRLKKPIFTIPTETADDGGSGKYKGLGYSFYIEGNFMPEDEYPGVIHSRLYLFGNMIKESARD